MSLQTSNNLVIEPIGNDNVIFTKESFDSWMLQSNALFKTMRHEKHVGEKGKWLDSTTYLPPKRVADKSDILTCTVYRFADKYKVYITYANASMYRTIKKTLPTEEVAYKLVYQAMFQPESANRKVKVKIKHKK